MTTDLQTILHICQRLSKKGVEPTTAMIRAKLDRRVPLPMIIQGLKRWQNDPQAGESDHHDDAPQSGHNKQSDAQEALLNRIARLEEEVKALQAEVAALKQR
ncbi:hypothetical protein KJ365_07465 [Glaciecola sp. XM2]|uniref:hypothetical protein n=1 Tax=Glaciecola sp. XM2 TaxID=1914931 RepID=UPI001BDDCD5E|nr:hypothetical protein [Glaciecola sp. XM2]MBT1450719.1 hypothetical protein [Glaciecola sp. XM2]